MAGMTWLSEEAKLWGAGTGMLMAQLSAVIDACRVMAGCAADSLWA
jgi:hypothetical protein